VTRLLADIHSTQLQLVLCDRCWLPLGIARQRHNCSKNLSSVGSHCGLSETGIETPADARTVLPSSGCLFNCFPQQLASNLITSGRHCWIWRRCFLHLVNFTDRWDYWECSGCFRWEEGPSARRHGELADCQIVTHSMLNPSNAELNPICHLLALLGAHHILHVSRIRVNDLN